MVTYIQGIDHVQVAAPTGCEREARQFYGEVLGLEEIPKPKELKSVAGVGFGAGIKRFISELKKRFCQQKKHIQLFSFNELMN